MWNRVVELIGKEAAERLQAKYAGKELYIPKITLTTLIQEMLETMSYKEIAEHLKISIATVYRHSKKC